MRALPLVLAAALAGCGDPAGDDPPPPAPDRATLPEEPEPMDALSALGYAAWDEDADEQASGVVLHDRERAWRGYNLFTNDVDRALLVDMDGRVVHSWRLPGRHRFEWADLLEGGDVLAVSVGECAARLAWDGTPVWTLEEPAHHDARQGEDGSVWTIVWGETVPLAGRPVRFDELVRLDEQGAPLERWDTLEHQPALLAMHGPTDLDEPLPEGAEPERPYFDYYHLNSVQPLPATPLGERDPRFGAGNLLICLRNVDTICILDRETLEVVWHWGQGELQLPHMPTMLPSGNVLVFDNGTWRERSRVLELDPVTNEVVWSWGDAPDQDLWSRWRGSAQRLPNGNTLICESERGRAFEVTPGGEVVWDFWNPELVDGKRKRIYRMTRVAPELVEPLLAAGRPSGD
jgi:hypothetical protein